MANNYFFAVVERVRRINRYMLENDCYDPRRYRQFPAQYDENDQGNPIPWTLVRRRQIFRVSGQYYEL